MELHPRLTEYINSRSEELFDLITEMIPDNRDSERIPKGSIGEQEIEDWSDLVVKTEPISFATRDYNDRTSSKWVSFSGHPPLGFDTDEYSEFKKMVDKICKVPEVSSRVSRGFIEGRLFELIIKKYIGEFTETIADGLLQLCEESIVENTYCFPILYLNISKTFQMGDVGVRYFTKRDFDWLRDKFTRDHPESDNTHFDALRKEYQGKTIVSCIVEAEPGEGKKIAFERCSLAIDILKICSDTLDLPDYPLDFDIDLRTKLQSNGTIITHGPIGVDKFIISHRNLINHIYLGEKEFERIDSRSIRYFSDFLLVKKYTDELSLLIRDGVQHFANALSERDLHRRVAQIFSIYESLILPGDQAGILDSLQKYVPKLIHNDPDIRNNIKDLLKSFYKIRSSMVHHAKRLEIDQEQLSQLQHGLSSLLLSMLVKRVNEGHTTKQSILKEIDDAINRA